MKVLKYLPLLTFLFLAACTGDQGPVGPAGAPGNANVKSGAIAPTNAEWLWNSNYCLQTSPSSTTCWFTRYVDVAVAEIDSNIVDNGAVLVFMEPDPGTNRWVPLNYSYTSFGGTYMFNYAYEVMDGNLRLHFYMTPNTGANPSSQTWTLATLKFRYVIIAGKALQLIQSGEAGVDVRDYESVKAFYESFSVREEPWQ